MRVSGGGGVGGVGGGVVEEATSLFQYAQTWQQGIAPTYLYILFVAKCYGIRISNILVDFFCSVSRIACGEEHDVTLMEEEGGMYKIIFGTPQKRYSMQRCDTN